MLREGSEVTREATRETLSVADVVEKYGKPYVGVGNAKIFTVSGTDAEQMFKLMNSKIPRERSRGKRRAKQAIKSLEKQAAALASALEELTNSSSRATANRMRKTLKKPA